MCPNCTSSNTVALTNSMDQCKDCRHTWNSTTMPTQVFNSTEMDRLATYRAAVQAGFYNEFPQNIRVTHFMHWK